MPPKKKVKAAAPATTRQTRSTASTAPAATNNDTPTVAAKKSTPKKPSVAAKAEEQPAQMATPAPSVKSSRSKNTDASPTSSDEMPTATETMSNGKRKRQAKEGGDFESATRKPKAAPKAPRAREPLKKSINTKYKHTTCESWFNHYKAEGRSSDEPEVLDGASFERWLGDLGVASEGITMYILLWMCRAQQFMSITKDEFMQAMDAMQMDSNEKLLAKLPSIIAEVRPGYSSPKFLALYKFCFNHFKPANAKNLEVAVASELFKVLLDEKKYSLDWEPDEDDGEQEMEDAGGKVDLKESPGLFPHRDAFLSYLLRTEKPTLVLTRDQYDQFIPFNKDVPFNLAGYNADESTWPTMFDSYIIWRQELQPELAAQKRETE